MKIRVSLIKLPISMRIFIVILLILLLLILHVESLTTSPKRSTYIVQMNKSLMPKVFTTSKKWYSSMINNFLSISHNIQNQYSSPSLIYTYDHAIHGFSALLSPSELEILKNLPGFISATSDDFVKLHTTYTPEFLSLTQSYGLWQVSDYGKNVIIGVVDSGVWPEHPSFNDRGMTPDIPDKWRRSGSCQQGQEFNSSMCNLKLIGAKYFNQGLKTKKNIDKVSMASARDTKGHGTVVSSIVAGNYVHGASYFGYAKGKAKGVAPHARLAVYKVAWEEGSMTSDVVAGIETAIDDGVDVITLSSSNNIFKSWENPVSASLFSAMEKGIVVTCSAGNTGPAIATVDNGFPWVITVTAGTISRWFAGTLTLGQGFKIIGWSTFPGNSSLQNVPLLYKKPLSSCDSVPLLSKVGNAIVVCDPVGSVTDQISNVTKSNALGAIFVSRSQIVSIPCPCIIIKPKEQRVVMEYINSTDNPLASIEFQENVTATNSPPFVAGYASRGPVYDFGGFVKPDIMAPGTRVLGAWIPTRPTAQLGTNFVLYSDFNLRTGTSYASPHVAGVAALLKGVHPEWSPAAIRSAIMTTAKAVDARYKPLRDGGNGFQEASPLAMGSGLISPDLALDPGLIYDATPQDYINLLCFYLDRERISIVTKSDNFSCENPSGDLNYPSFIVVYNDTSSTKVKKFERSVTNVGRSEAIYKANVIPPLNCLVNVTPERLEFGRKGVKKRYEVTITYRGNENKTVSYGEVVWIQEESTSRRRRVRSPIVLSPKLS